MPHFICGYRRKRTVSSAPCWHACHHTDNTPAGLRSNRLRCTRGATSVRGSCCRRRRSGSASMDAACPFRRGWRLCRCDRERWSTSSSPAAAASSRSPRMALCGRRAPLPVGEAARRADARALSRVPPVLHAVVAVLHDSTFCWAGWLGDQQGGCRHDLLPCRVRRPPAQDVSGAAAWLDRLAGYRPGQGRDDGGAADGAHHDQARRCQGGLRPAEP
mmetsp:Transcript_30028/g.64542  ORF Transcript_30028/g.64542 Transcript_30028/m.64542 type:complete len:217 (+) Transcript_30028:54-704(+)